MRLIDADALLMKMNLAIAILEGTMKNLGLQDDAECQMELKAYRDIRDGIKDEPTIEPTAQPEHKRGEWILQSDDHHEYYECDQCGICVGLFDVRNFCCNCGADMRKERKG